MPGQLFTSYFLEEGIQHTAAWQESLANPGDLEAFHADVTNHYNRISAYHAPNEAVTEQELIRPLFALLGWVDYLPQQGSDLNEDIPDHLLFGDAASKARGRYPDALAVAESKRFDQSLDARGQTSSPHGQILRYLATADIDSDGRIRWGFLTNGRVWRLYDRRARPRASGYHEVDLAAVVRAEDDFHGLRAFRLLFGRAAFSPQHGERTSFLEEAIAEGRRHEERVARDLSGVVFDAVYPDLLRGLAEKSGADLADVRQAALIFLYRLLFLLYAEDRGLLPVNDSRYADYGLRKHVRDDIAQRMAARDTFSNVASHYHNHIATLCRQVDEGDASIGLPAYNGGLFASNTAPLLDRVRLSDAQLAPIIYALSHTEIETGRRFVNYRDMSVQQLGSIYERLLEQEPARGEDGSVLIRQGPYARRDSGSFYTPQPLVDLIIERTLGPLLEEHQAVFEAEAAVLKSDRRDKVARAAELRPFDPAVAALGLKALDPAMGSGHFLVTAVDYLSDAIAELVENASNAVPWLDGLYTSPLLDRIAALRRDILARAHAAAWVIDESQLTDQAIIRRMVLKRCVYGVDKNPLTVELAKVSLWLHSFTVGAPLSFLDHHLRCGDSLIGLRVHEATAEMQRLGGFTAASAVQDAEKADQDMERIEAMSDADIAEVEASAALFRDVEETTAPLRGLLNTLCGANWLAAGMKKSERTDFEIPLVGVFALGEEQAFSLLAEGPDRVAAAASIRQRSFWPAFSELWREAGDLAARERFLYWEAAFPGVWHGWQDDQPAGGFDAVIGNPPWDQIEQQEVEWFALRDQQVALAPTGAKRKALIRQRTRSGDELALAYQAVRSRAAKMRAVVKDSGNYPLLSGGRVNLYSLFVERAANLIRPDGIVGLLTPSGIYADKTAAGFFKSVSTSGRLGGLFDFENKSVFFKDVDSRFKFCALIFGGKERKFDATDCAFFLRDTAELDDADRCFPLSPSDFARVNPNTGTAPVFRSRRDANITRRIYERHPVLVDRTLGEESKAWPVRFMQGLYNMTSDSYLFRAAAELEADGFYPVQGNRWKRGEELYLPLYQGRMIWHFDHRANAVRVNPENTHNPYLSDEVTEAQHADPDFLPQTQYWIPAADVETVWPQAQGWTLGFRGIARPTDADGFLSQECPSCEQRFKVIFGEGSEDPVSCCPYCGHHEQDCWHTRAQADYMQSVAANVALGPELQKLERQLKGMSKGLFKVSMTSSLPKPLPAPMETDDLLDILHLPCCNETIKVARQERHFCIICGTEFDMAISESKKVFLSHKNVDKDMVVDFKETLELLGYDPWLDEEAMPTGESVDRGISQGMQDSCGVVFFITKSFEDKGFLEDEINYARQQKRDKGDKFAIVILRFTDADGNAGEIPELFKHLRWETPKTRLEALRAIIRTLPVAPGSVDWRDGNTTPGTRSTSTELSEEAKAILKAALKAAEAKETGDGRITHVRHLNGQAITVRGKSLIPEDGNPQTVARWVGGLEDLERRGYIRKYFKDRGRKAFEVTHEGYEAAK